MIEFVLKNIKEGFGMDKNAILNNYIELQTVLRNGNLNF